MDKLIGMPAWIKAVRDDQVVGRGSCSSIDECYSDVELQEMLNTFNIRGKIESVRFCRQQENLYREQEGNTRD